QKSKTLPRMESSEVISTEKPTVVIQLNPQATQDGVICDEGDYHYTALKRLFKAEPKALGTVQIMVGLMVFFLGIVLRIRVPEYSYYGVFEYSGITYWGSLVYISAGSLSVAAQNKLYPCLVKASLLMNVISAMTATLAIVLMSIQCRHDLGIIGILLVFSILEFIISICISVFACKATMLQCCIYAYFVIYLKTVLLHQAHVFSFSCLTWRKRLYLLTKFLNEYILNVC
uniref:Uncharacterized protein n=1 Tax=Cyprinus carpio TaxID=7962 RepID=A0A8C1WD87_CYPCA